MGAVKGKNGSSKREEWEQNKGRMGAVKGKNGSRIREEWEQ